MSNHPLTFLCVMAATKGLYAEPFLRQAKELGCRILVLTNAKALVYDWPRELIDELYAVKDIFDPVDVLNTVSYVARHEQIDRIVGLGEYDIEIASALREHLRLPGMGLSTSHYFRDKLAMRKRAQALGIPVPEFVHVLNYQAVGEFMHRVPGPWVLKPRTGASSLGIKKIDHPETLWRILDTLGDQQSHHLLEQFVPGEVFHVDSIVDQRQVQFAQAHRYGTPILELHTTGGVYTTRSLERGTPDEVALQAINRQVIEGLGLVEGVTHIEYIKSAADGRFYFLEASARVGAGMIEDIVEATSGLNLWKEWAKIEIAQHREPYRMPKPRQDYAGVAICMTTIEHPDVSGYAAPGVRALEPKPYHAGVLIQSHDPREVEAKIQQYARRLEHDFLAPAHA
ncbi:ATP-grasp domain-containing protein [bacterium]|nr:ATP-grasp domain-containing protein [bacterium]